MSRNDGQVQLLITETQHWGGKRVTRDSNVPLKTRSVLAPQPFLSLIPISVWANFIQTAWTPAMITASHVHWSSRLWFCAAFIYPSSLSLSIYIPPLLPSSKVLLAAIQIFLIFNFGDWQPWRYLPFICILCSLLSIPATNGGDSQTAVPELVCSSLGVRAANQRLWWEEKDGFKLHPSQSTGGAHESATSRRFSPSWGSLQIDSDSTPLTSETPTRASPIKSLLWFPLLIIDASELDRAVIGTCLRLLGARMRSCECVCSLLWLEMCVCVCVCACKLFVVVFCFESVHVLCLFMCIRCGVSFHAVSTSCLWWWLPYKHNWKAITRLSGNWRCHIEFQQEIWRGASLFTAEVDAGKSETVFQEKCVAANTVWPCDFCTNIDHVPEHLES